ncbi:ABC transporter permease [Leminorella grimontii]|uniref:ABC transporter permease n=1 Tax=Leminorella grimontii TaxID=82981 RepID=A0AAV5N9Z9_9GAMM|nr:amino acid ABC transporter permease [Leminorella grimontii]KFC93398.1 permease component of a glutamate/aspartate transporter [Leminorella grimontii ATCC 33999 = DSM 5078]GKX57377.1 ABC transporter permease [Leminorella grimontii]GKX61178.1 ABC transporter permease [Leminorella grimontii]VFS54917.1 Inner membrane amino-acid ABC transporter permease protein yecS [Leminorella grimontii]
MTEKITQWLMAPQYLGWLWDGFLLTLGLSAVSIVAATLLGAIVAGARDSRLALLRLPSVAFCTLFRNTPLLVQLFFWYFGVGKLLPEGVIPWLNTPHEATLFGVTVAWPSFEFISAVFGLTVYFSAFIAEEIRSGIRGVAAGQKNAALALGLTGWQSMRFVILPQAIKIAFPPLLGQYMNIVKSTSLAMAIGVAELSYASRQVETETLRAFQAFGVATVLYIVTIALMEAWGMWYEHRLLAKGRR